MENVYVKITWWKTLTSKLRGEKGLRQNCVAEKIYVKIAWRKRLTSKLRGGKGLLRNYAGKTFTSKLRDGKRLRQYYAAENVQSCDLSLKRAQIFIHNRHDHILQLVKTLEFHYLQKTLS